NVICGKKSFVYDYKVKRLRLSMEDSEERRKQIIDIYEERDNLRGNLIKSGKKSFKAYFDNWKIKSIQDLYFDLYKDREMFDKISSEMFDEKDIDILFKDEKFYLQSNIIDADDLSAMVYLKFNIEGIDEKNKFKHILIDEAQDYSLFELYILKNMTILNSLTIVGDLAQGIYYYRGVNSWETLKQEVFENYAQIDNLTLSYRSTVEIIEFSNKVLKKQNLENGVPTPVLRHGDKPSVIKCENELAFIEKLKDIENEVSKQGRKNIAIICKTASQCKALKKILNKNKIKDYSIVEEKSKNIKSDKIIIPSYLTKGLEFDATIIYDLSDDNYKETSLDLKILYVILTRALHLEYIIYFDKISNLIYNNY
ncbi:MAG: 3'-5' exonuclease, partial [Clostridiaceae bacterium]